MNKYYPLQLWLTSIAIAPVLFFIIGFINSPNLNGESGAFAMLLMFVFFGLLYSLPVFIITYIIYKLTIHRTQNTLFAKVILNVVSVVGVWVTFMIIQGVDSFNWKGNRSGLVFSLIYSASIFISSTLYRIRKHQGEQPITS